MSDRHARVDARLPALPDTVLAHLTEPELLTRWWPTGADTEPRPGGRYHLWWDGPDWHLRGEYLEIDLPRFVWTWKWDHDDLPVRTVVMSLRAGGDGATEISVDHEAESAEERASYVEGWEHFLGVLGEVLTTE